MRRLVAVAILVLGACAACSENRPEEPAVANLWVDTTGGDCRYTSSPRAYDPLRACGSLREAYEAAPRGGTVRVRPGRYPDQSFGGVRDTAAGNDTPAAHTGRVTFIGSPERPGEVKIRRLHFGGEGVTIDGFDVDTGGENPGADGATLEIAGTARDVTVRNSRVGNVDCQKGAQVGGDPGPPQPETLGIVFDNVVFHDVVVTDPAAGCHNECIKVEAQAITIRNSTFVNCSTMSISMGIGDHYGMGPYCCVTFENNVVGHNTNGSDETWHAGANLGWFVGSFERARIVNNTFERGIGMAPEHVGPGPYSGVIANNVGGGWACLPGVTYSGNVGTKCGDSDVEVTPAESTVDTPAAFGWTEDLHLTADSPAIGAADPKYAPKTDREGNPRVGAPDAGAFEYTE